MSWFESQMENCLVESRSPRIGEFGGFTRLLTCSDEIANSSYAPEFVGMALVSESAELGEAEEFIASVIERVTNDIAIAEIVDALENGPSISNVLHQRLFNRWLSLALDKKVAAFGRAAALRGALLFKKSDARRALRLLTEIADADLDDDPFYLAHAACIGGFLYAEQAHAAFPAFLDAVAGIDGVSDQALFEMGMARLGDALNGTSVFDVRTAMSEAKKHFESAANITESRWDAKVFAGALGMLEDFYERRPFAQMKDQITALRGDAFAYSAYVYEADGNAILSARGAQVAAWASLAVRLESLTGSIEEDVWVDGSSIIEDELLSTYTASRTILKRSSDGGLELLVRPRVEASLIEDAVKLKQFRKWLERNGRSEIGAAAEDLLAIVDESLAGRTSSDPSVAAVGGQPFAAILEAGRRLPGDQNDAVMAAVLAVTEIELNKLSPSIIECIKAVDTEFSTLSDFKLPEARSLFLALVFKTMLFIEHRLDTTKGQDSTGEYLFADPSKPDALEKELQQDYLRFLRASKLGSHDEVRGVAAGRADVYHELGRIKLITEIKREQSDASFEDLIADYGEQTAMYQMTNVKLGILLVLDLTEAARLGRALSECYRPVVSDIMNDGTLRGVLVVRLPGNRMTPSEATETAPRRRKATRSMMSPPT